MAPKNYLRNSETQDLLRCMPVELLRMQRALKKESKETYVGGKPLIGELYTKIDKDGSIRDDVWDRLAQSDRFFVRALSLTPVPKTLHVVVMSISSIHGLQSDFEIGSNAHRRPMGG